MPQLPGFEGYRIKGRFAVGKAGNYLPDVLRVALSAGVDKVENGFLHVIERDRGQWQRFQFGLGCVDLAACLLIIGVQYGCRLFDLCVSGGNFIKIFISHGCISSVVRWGRSIWHGSGDSFR